MLIDCNSVAYNENSSWTSYNLNVNKYLDGSLHLLQLTQGGDRGSCYIGNADAISRFVANAVDVEGIKYALYDNYAKVISCSEAVEVANIHSKLTINEIQYVVNSIFLYAFTLAENLQSATIPESITSIGSNAFFNCDGLKSLTYNATNCSKCSSSSFPSNISTLILGNNVQCIPNYFLYNGSQIEILTLPDNLTTIGTYAFNSSSKLKSVVIPASTTEIGSYAFFNCTALIKSAYPIGLSNPFSYGASIAYPIEYTVDTNNVIYDKDKTSIYFAPLLLENGYTIPEYVNSINASAFRGCCNLESIIIPETISSIGNSAFIDCNNLTSLTFNAPNCASCGSSNSPAFPSSISDLTFGNNVTKIPAYFLYNGSQIENVTLPSPLTDIGASAFRNSTQLTSLEIPCGVSSIGTSAFSGCSSLTSLTFNATNCTSCGSSSNPAFPSTISTLTIGNSVTQIPAYFLYNGSKIESVSIPNSVTTIGGCAFYNCTSLKSLTLGSGLLSIGSNAFSYSSSSSTNSKISIAKVFWLGNTPPSGYDRVSAMVNYVANDQYKLSNQVKYQFLSSKFLVDGTYYVPVSPSDRTCDVVDCEYSLSNGDIVISDKVTNRGVELSVLNINDYSFYDNQSITSLSAGNNGKIGESAFYNCGALTTVIANNDGSIGNNAFYNCDALTTVTVNNNGNIGDNAFYNCDGSFTLVAANKGYIGSQTFGNCTGLTEIDITSKGNIGNEAFKNCTSLVNAQIDNVGSVGDDAFYGCKVLTEAILGDSISSIGSYAFAGCSSLPNITLPNNITAIGEYIFNGCSNLESVNIGSGIASIPRYAFKSCSALNNLTIPNNVQSIGDYALSGCRSLANLTIEENEQEDDEEGDTSSMQTFDDWTSDNHGDSSTSYKEYTLNVVAGDELSFNYTVDSESSYDYLIVKINGVEVVKESGNKTGIYRKTFTDPGNVTLYLSYTKDSSQSSGQDKASVYNIALNGNGIVIDNLHLGSNGSSPLFSDCPLDQVYIGRKLGYDTSSGKGYSPFYRNTSLRSVEITDAETEIYDNEFYGCTNLQTLKIGNGVKTIGNWAFSGCSSLDYFSAGYNVESIGAEAFSDCTGLKNYYSFSVNPPVCGSQALDDINKWDCTLHVPAESSDEYMAADQWKDFFFINETDAVLAESMHLNVESLEGLTGESFQLVASILPANATRKRVAWSSSNPEVVTVDSEGLASFLTEGEAVITVMTTDGSGVEASINVVVRIKEPELGDSNANGVVNIADVVNIANYALGNEVDHFNAAASDVNKDGNISMADATATVTIILEQDVAKTSVAKVRARAQSMESDGDLLVIDDCTAQVGETASLFVALENSVDYVALQADVVLPEGMTLVDVKIGNRAAGHHSLITRRINNRTTRIALFDLQNNAFADNGEAILELVVKSDSATNRNIEITNIFASDAHASEYVLTAIGGQNSEMSGIEGVAGENIRVKASSGVINIFNAAGCEIAVYAMDGTLISRFTAESAFESCRVANGVYVVAVGNKVEKVVVK